MRSRARTKRRRLLLAIGNKPWLPALRRLGEALPGFTLGDKLDACGSQT